MLLRFGPFLNRRDPSNDCLRTREKPKTRCYYGLGCSFYEINNGAVGDTSRPIARALLVAISTPLNRTKLEWALLPMLPPISGSSSSVSALKGIAHYIRTVWSSQELRVESCRITLALLEQNWSRSPDVDN